MSEETLRESKRTERLDDHSKRILTLENNQQRILMEQADVRKLLYSMSEALFGSSDPHATSMKEKINSINAIVVDFARNYKDDLKGIKVELEKFNAIENWKVNTVDPYLQEQKENKKDWKQFGMQGLMWLITFLLGGYLSHLIFS